MAYVTRSGAQFLFNGSRFRFVGGNFYPLFYTTAPQTQAQLDTFFQGCSADGVRVIRTWIYNNFQPASNAAGIFQYLSGGSIVYREASFAYADLVLARARLAGVKLILVMTDWKSDNPGDGGNPTVDYLRWSDSINGTQTLTQHQVSVSAVSGDGATATWTTGSAHGFHVGDTLAIAGADQAGFNNANTMVLTAPSSTTFTNSCTQSGAGTGTITATRGANHLQSFYNDPNIQTLFKNYLSQWVNRVNTVNGLTYQNDDTIFSWELGNEMRFDRNNDPHFGASNSYNLAVLGASGGWIDTMSTYLKSIDPNHLIGSTDLAHTTDNVTGDTIHNGTSYGIDFTTTGSLTNVDYFDVHIYPYQGDNVHLQKYGQALGFPNSASMQGLRAQMDKFCQLAHAQGKPMIVGEWGVIKTNNSNDLYTNYPRSVHFQKAMDDFFASDGDGFIPWHYYGQEPYGTDNNYGIQSQGTYPNSAPFTSMPALNQTDMPLIDYFRARNKQLQGKRIVVSDLDAGMPGL